MRGTLSHWLLWYVCGFAIILALLVTCLMPAEDLPSVDVSDKIEHLAAYLCLAIWFGGLLQPRSYLRLLLCLLALGGGIEIAQDLMKVGRHAEWNDFFADALGALAGLLLCLVGLRHWASWIERRVCGQ